MTKTDKPTISGLKKILPIAKDFSVVMDYFLRISETNRPELDGVAETGELSQLFHTIVSSVISATKKSKTVSMKNFLCVEVAHANFVHGGAMTPLGMVTFLYFRDLDQGMVGISSFTSSQVYYARIKAVASIIDSFKKPSNPN